MSLIALAAATAAVAAEPIRYTDLHLSPIAFDLGILQIRWYSLGYIAGILLGWWWLTKLIDQPGAPMARRHADDFVFYATLGIILGGRIAYVIFYDPWMLRDDPLQAFRLWDGGMSFHGGAFGTVVAVWWLAWRNKLSSLRMIDYVACCAGFGLFLVRLANFANGELWGRITDVPWAVIFPGADAGPYPRHPSQLYEAALEGLVLWCVLNWFFWRTRARYWPGFLLGVFLTGYGIARFAVEFVREPDVQLGILPWGLSMGQTLSAPMIVAGVYFMATAKGRRVRVEPIAGSDSVA
jgi:phosphatidylglycerol:prolipoprotein diacylglycerol transferase